MLDQAGRKAIISYIAPTHPRRAVPREIKVSYAALIGRKNPLSSMRP